MPKIVGVPENVRPQRRYPKQQPENSQKTLSFDALFPHDVSLNDTYTFRGLTQIFYNLFLLFLYIAVQGNKIAIRNSTSAIVFLLVSYKATLCTQCLSSFGSCHIMAVES